MSLDKIAIKHRADKSSLHHGYCEIYEKYFGTLKNTNCVFWEIGVGGYQFADRGGEGLRTWREYFTDAKIFGFDIHKKKFEVKGCEIHQISQTDIALFNRVSSLNGKPDIIIDDASHNSNLTIFTFEGLFPLLKSGGIYVVEDLETSYWENDEFKGSTKIKDLNVLSSMNYFKLLTDSLNYKHHTCEFKEFTKDILSIHFYEKLIFILKK